MMPKTCCFKIPFTIYFSLANRAKQMKIDGVIQYLSAYEIVDIINIVYHFVHGVKISTIS